MTGSMAGSFTVHLESAGKCSHEMTGNCETPKGAGAPNAKKKASVRSGKSPSLVRSWSPSPSTGKHDHHDHHHQFHIGLVTVGGLRPAIVAGVEHLVTQCGDGRPSEAMLTWRAQMDAIKSDRIWHFVMKKTGESTDVSHSIRKSKPFKTSVRNSEKVSEICGSPSSSEICTTLSSQTSQIDVSLEDLCQVSHPVGPYEMTNWMWCQIQLHSTIYWTAILQHGRYHLCKYWMLFESFWETSKCSRYWHLAEQDACRKGRTGT
jgi:hypothetical protein